MQLYALDEKECLVFAPHATKHRDYFCLECKSIVRRRGGDYRQVHYYHLSSVSCHLSGKSMTHLQVQSHIVDLLPQGEAQMEYRFPAISRIADVVWLPQKLVFEIQCSAITAEEVQARNADYSAQGFHVIWILHDNRYNQRRLTAAEKYLESDETLPHYFTNIDQEGQGFIYDQFSLVGKGMRHVKLSPLPVKVAFPTRLDAGKTLEKDEIVPSKFASNMMLPKTITKFGKHRKVCFHGDLLEQSSRMLISDDFKEYINKAVQHENEFVGECFTNNFSQRSIFNNLEQVLISWIIRPFSLLFQIILERSCK